MRFDLSHFLVDPYFLVDLYQDRSILVVLTNHNIRLKRYKEYNYIRNKFQSLIFIYH